MNNPTNNALFHRRTLNNALRTFAFPPDLETRRQKIEPWIAALKRGTLDEIKEISLHGNFLNDIFQEILGYRSVIQGGGEAWEIHAEKTISAGGGSADGALGFFTATAGEGSRATLEGRVVAPIELKGARTDLDRPAGGRKESPIEQGWRYANYTADCRWIIVSNYRELRLYQTSKTPAYCEQFLLSDLADIEAFKRFYFLLCRQNFLPKQNKPDAVSAIDVLLAQSNEAQEEITKKLYEEYKAVRLNLVKHFRFKGVKDIPDREAVLIEKAQKTLNRVLFVAFCEDRGLLPAKTISNAHDRKDPYNPRPIWENYKAVFRWIDRGNDEPPIPEYNGGLFKPDPLLDDQLTVTDPLCSQLKQLTRFDFETEVSVDILGHIFEQSITDLEELKAEASGQEYDKKKGKRKTQGVFYTPAYITQYIVEVSLGAYLKQREQELRVKRSYPAGNRFQLEQIPQRAVKKRQSAERQFWETYRDEVLKKTRVIDPACGSGAFLIAAFDYLMREYERVNQAIAALELGDASSDFLGQRSIFDLNATILSNNLYGVDLSSESVEITKLSLWLKTAERGKPLTYLDDNIKAGNSIVDDSQVTERAFQWEREFAAVFADGGFDVVIGNPPYVRQELLSPVKPYLQQHYQSYDGVADLYTYFYEKGLNILKPGGVLSYIVTNKWLKSGYGEPLRRFFTENGVVEQIVDFGHAPIFEDADTFPCIVAVRKLPSHPSEAEVKVCPVPREKLRDINLTQYVEQNGYSLPWLRFTASSWSLEPPAVENLMQKIKRVGVPIKNFAGVKPLYGIKTGCNEAFCIDEATKNYLVQSEPKSSEIIKPFLRGQDIKRWLPEWANLWIIFAHREIDINNYPSVKNHLQNYRSKLEARAGKQLWWQWQSSPAFHELFEQPKLIYQEIQFHPAYSYDERGYLTNNKAFILPKADLYILAVLNSPLIWWYNWRYLPHMKDDALSPVGELMENFPIAPPTDEIRAEVEAIAPRLIEITKTNQEACRDVLEWLRLEQGIDKPGQKLEDFSRLDADAFVQEIKKRKPKSAGSLTPAALKAIRSVYSEYAPAIQSRLSEALTLERRLSDLVNQAYGLTPEEIDLMWKTAPPRMPMSRDNYN